MEDMGFYKKLLDNISDGAYFVDRNGRITYWNKAAENISGYRQDEVIGKQCSDNILIHLDSQGNKLCLNGCPLKKSITDGMPRTAEVYLHHKKGFRLPVAVQVAPIRSDDGEIIGAVELFSDNSSKVAAIQKIKELENIVYTDQLTGLANRKYIEIFLQSHLEEMRRYNWLFGVLFVDIDHFNLLMIPTVTILGMMC